MTDVGQHPTLDDVQRYVDDVLDPARDAGIAVHVTSCPSCRADVERLRAVTAALALASAPPANLLERIQARRRANELVILPRPTTDEGTGTERVAASERRMVAALSLASRPPDDLLERIMARRAAGEQVLLPSVPGDAIRGGATPARAEPAAAAPARTRGAWSRTWRWAAGPGIAAAVTFVAARAYLSSGSMVAEAGRVADTPAAPSVAAPTGAPAAATREPAAPAATTAHTRPIRVASAERTTGRERTRGPLNRGIELRPAAPQTAPAARDSASAAELESAPSVTEGETPEGLRFGFAVKGEGTELDSHQRDAVDRAARVAREDSTRGVVIRYTDRSEALVERISGRLMDAGIAHDRIRPHRVPSVRLGLGGPPREDAIEFVIQWPRDDER
jgi:hypothetical protein